MLALTVLQPFAYSIRHLKKPIENRDWAPPPALIGKRFCLHAGKLDETSPERQWKECHETLTSLEDAGIAMPEGIGRKEMAEQSGAIVAVVTLDRAIRRGDGDPLNKSVWRADTEFAWVLTNVTPIEPVKCRGMQKLWTVPEDIASVVKARYQAAIASHEG